MAQTGKWGEMKGQNQRVFLRGALVKVLPGSNCLRGRVVHASIPIRVLNLYWMEGYIGHIQKAFSLGLDLDSNVPNCVAGRGDGSNAWNDYCLGVNCFQLRSEGREFLTGSAGCPLRQLAEIRL